MNRKAVSAVVATVLIILITIAAVAIIWSAIIPMIQNQLTGSGDCLDAAGHMGLNVDTTCYKKIWLNASNLSDYGYGYNETDNRWTINGTEVLLGVKRAQGVFDVTAIMTKVYANGRTYSEKILASAGYNFGPNTENLIKIANVSYNGVAKITYSTIIKPAAGVAEKECAAVSEIVAKECAA